MDEKFSESIMALITGSAKHGSELNQMIDRNLSQGLGVVQNTIVQSQGASADDAQLLSALQAAVGSPRQGAVTT